MKLETLAVVLHRFFFFDHYVVSTHSFGKPPSVCDSKTSWWSTGISKVFSEMENYTIGVHMVIKRRANSSAAQIIWWGVATEMSPAWVTISLPAMRL